MASLRELLGASLSPDQQQREAAEQNLQGVSLLTLAQFLESEGDAALRQTALVLLKNGVVKHWSPTFPEFCEPLCPDQDRPTIRHLVFKLVGDSERSIRLQAGYITSRIVASDYPDEWATVLDDLLRILQKPPSEAWLHGALVVMKDFVEDSMSEEQFLPIAQNLVEYLLAIASESNHPSGVRAQAIHVFISCLDALEMLSSTRREGIRVFVQHALPPWLELIASIVASKSDEELKSAAIETISKMRILFPAPLAQYMPAIFVPIYASLNAADPFEESALVQQQVEFLRKAVQARIIQEDTLSIQASFEGCIALALKFAQITPTMEEEWQSDLDGFVEDLDETSFSTRRLCTDLLEDLSELHPEWLNQTLESAIRHYLEASASEHLWRQQEALIFCLITMVHRSDNANMLLEKALQAENPFLRARSAIYAAQIGVASCLPLVLAMLESDSILARLCAIKAMSKFADSSDQVKVDQAAILKRMTAKLDSLPASSLLMVAEAVAPIVQLEPSVVLRETTILPSFFTLLGGNPGDISLVAQVVDIFESLASSVDFAQLCSVVLPILFNTISNEPALRSIALDILSGMIEGSEQLPDGFVTAIWPVFTISLEVEELQTAHEILRNLVKKAWPQIVAGNHVQDLLSVIGTAFEGDESTSFYVPQLVISLIRQAGASLNDILPELLKIISQKLQVPGLSSAYQQNLISVFAVIACTQAASLVDFLVQMQALQVVMSTWCEVFPDFHGYSAIRSSVVGLCEMYKVHAAAPSPLDDILVKGDLISDSSGKIVTRSRARTHPEQYTQVPVAVKILKLLVAELVNENEGLREDEEVVSDDEWDTDLDKVLEEAQLNEAELQRLDEDSEDPLSTINTREYITNFIGYLSSSGDRVRADTQALASSEQQALASILS
ncbi:armadillo-type protein [Protomyces lactucae-debilis]|uniref:Armadillo-type protein n=1 Tax=Protomyces lactucae-debilis TaxID=2754530 RepID=A0A1Y2FNZ5_PROLT|nr:armadillo-type protein [Protomyces lactucae-debilis]ORY85698.1 armadillo-type protein [Protomyces lactucae-debilis]